MKKSLSIVDRCLPLLPAGRMKAVLPAGIPVPEGRDDRDGTGTVRRLSFLNGIASAGTVRAVPVRRAFPAGRTVSGESRRFFRPPPCCPSAFRRLLSPRGPAGSVCIAVFPLFPSADCLRDTRRAVPAVN